MCAAGRSQGQAQTVALVSSRAVQSGRLSFHPCFELGDAGSPTSRSRGFPGAPVPREGPRTPFPHSEVAVARGAALLRWADDSAVCHKQPGSRPPCSAGHTHWTLAADPGPVPRPGAAGRGGPSCRVVRGKTTALRPLPLWSLGCAVWPVGGVAGGGLGRQWPDRGAEALSRAECRPQLGMPPEAVHGGGGTAARPGLCRRDGEVGPRGRSGASPTYGRWRPAGLRALCGGCSLPAGRCCHPPHARGRGGARAYLRPSGESPSFSKPRFPRG